MSGAISVSPLDRMPSAALGGGGGAAVGCAGADARQNHRGANGHDQMSGDDVHRSPPLGNELMSGLTAAG